MESNFKSFIDNYFKEIEDKRKNVSSKSYIEWLYNFCDGINIKGFSDDDFLYKEKCIDRQNSLLLSSFLDYVEDLAIQQRVLNFPNPKHEFETHNYVILIKDKFYEITNMCGQGSITFIELVEKPNFCYVKII